MHNYACIKIDTQKHEKKSHTHTHMNMHTCTFFFLIAAGCPWQIACSFQGSELLGCICVSWLCSGIRSSPWSALHHVNNQARLPALGEKQVRGILQPHQQGARQSTDINKWPSMPRRQQEQHLFIFFWNRYHGFKPRILQKILIIFP